MREFFDRFDSGAYDGISLAVVGLLLVAMTVWHFITSRRNKKAFFAARAAAHESFMRLGAEDVTTQLHVMEALNAWGVWQHRPVPSASDIGDYPTPEEWELLPLLGTNPEGSGRYVH